MGFTRCQLIALIFGIALVQSSCKTRTDGSAVESATSNDECHRPNPAATTKNSAVMPVSGNYVTTSTEGACNFELGQFGDADGDGNLFAIKISSNAPSRCSINKGMNLAFRLYLNNSFQSECFSGKGPTGKKLDYYGFINNGNSLIIVHHRYDESNQNNSPLETAVFTKTP